MSSNMRSLHDKLNAIASEVVDIDEVPVRKPETFLLFSDDLPSRNLGMINEKAKVLSIEVAGTEYEIRQSIGLLTSSNIEGTTGAALWKISPIAIDWLADESNVLWLNGILHADAVVVELGSGISGLLFYALRTKIASCILTDQRSVIKLLQENLDANTTNYPAITSKGRSNRKRTTTKTHSTTICALELNWENTDVEILDGVVEKDKNIDLIVACDCVYNDFLLEPLVRTCERLCRRTSGDTVVLFAQQIRSEEVFADFLALLSRTFVVWRVSNAQLPSALQTGSGYVVHLAVLRIPE